jgi:hypothetical protein
MSAAISLQVSHNEADHHPCHEWQKLAATTPSTDNW